MYAQIKDFAEFLSYVAFSLGIPAALFEYARQARSERRERELAIYDSLDEGFIEFQKLCLEYPYLDIADIPDERPQELDELQQKQEYTALLILFSLFERAYVMEIDNPTKVTMAQWIGWDRVIRAYFQRKNVIAAWQRVGEWFDPRFMEYMTTIVAAAPSLTANGPQTRRPVGV
jgi:hypothetical protein